MQVIYIGFAISRKTTTITYYFSFFLHNTNINSSLCMILCNVPCIRVTAPLIHTVEPLEHGKSFSKNKKIISNCNQRIHLYNLD